MNQHTKDQIFALRSEAKHHREQARRLRAAAKGAKERYDHIAWIRHSSDADYRTSLAKECDRQIDILKETMK